MAVARRAFFDTSILVSAFIEMGETPGPAEAIWTRLRTGARPPAADGLALRPRVLLGGDEAARRPAPGPQARRATRPRRDPRDGSRCATSRPTRATGFIDSIVRERVAGGRVYDAHIAEAARLAGAELVVTDNRRHFVPLLRHGIRVLTAAEFADEFGV